MELEDMRLRLTRAETSAQAAVLVAREAKTDVDNRVTKDEMRAHETEVSQWRTADTRRSRMYVIIAAVAMLAAIAAGWYVTTADDRFDDKLSKLVGQLQTSCQSRNAQLAAQQQIYRSFILTEQEDTAQPAGVQARKIEAYRSALNTLPQPVDCSQFESLSGVPEQQDVASR